MEFKIKTTNNMTTILDCGPGDYLPNVAEEAKNIAQSDNCIVEFFFNEILVRVDKDSDLERLSEVYSDAYVMNWSELGPEYEAYDLDTRIELDYRRNKQEEEREARRKAYEVEENNARQALDAKLKGVDVLWGDIDVWNKSLEANAGSDYGLAALEYAKSWAKLMQLEIAKGKTVQECYQEVQSELDFMGITGFMYGCAVSVLSSAWNWGEELRRAHNREYGHDGEGTVNPAVFSISY
jgi:hypothetical protein